MTHLRTAIEDAIKGGYIFVGEHSEKEIDYLTEIFADVAYVEKVLLHKRFWLCLGKQRRWDVVHSKKKVVCTECYGFGYLYDEDGENVGDCFTCAGTCREMREVTELRYPVIERWKTHWHRLIDHIASDKDIESFFKSLSQK